MVLLNYCWNKKTWTKQLLAEKFVDCFKRDPRLGYASRFYNFLNEVRDGDEFLAKIHNKSDKSGSAMRATTIGFCTSIDQILEKSKLQSEITHHSESGIVSAQAASLMAHYFIFNKGPKEKVGEFINDFINPLDLDHNWEKNYDQEVGEKGWMSVRAALTAIRQSDSLTQVLKRSVDFGGDVDTVAAIALGAASMSFEMEKDLPKHLYENLENSIYGREYLALLDKKLSTNI